MTFDDAWLAQQLEKPGYRLVGGSATALTPPRPAFRLPPDVPEGIMQEQLRDVAQDLGLLYYHTYSSKRSEPGWPDTALLHPASDTLYLVELKSATGVVSAPQRRWLEALAQVTHVVTVSLRQPIGHA